MTKIESMEGELLSHICKDISPVKYESIVIKNKLLSGKYHIQIIGTPVKYIEFTISSNETQVNKINMLQSEAEYLKLTGYNSIFIGTIDEVISWERFTIGYSNRDRILYEGRALMLIHSEEPL